MNTFAPANEATSAEQNEKLEYFMLTNVEIFSHLYSHKIKLLESLCSHS